MMGNMVTHELSFDSWKESIIEKIESYKTELFIIGFCIAMGMGTTYLFTRTLQGSYIPSKMQPVIQTSSERQNQPIFVDISGGVKKPDVYSVYPGARIRDIIRLAGGLSEAADKQYVDRNVNFARYVIDQDKIHIPTYEETKENKIIEEPQYIDYTTARTSKQLYPSMPIIKVDINAATKDELLAVSGISEKIADALIAQRPFAAIKDIYTKKIVTKTLYDALTPYITAKNP